MLSLYKFEHEKQILSNARIRVRLRTFDIIFSYKNLINWRENVNRIPSKKKAHSDMKCSFGTTLLNIILKSMIINIYIYVILF